MLDDLGTASMIRGDSELTSVHPKELCAKAPQVPPFQPCQGSARPCKPWQACSSQPVFTHGNALCNISSVSHQLLAADSYRCLVSSLKRQGKTERMREMRTRAEPKQECSVALMRKLAKMRQKRSRTRNLWMRRLRSMRERSHPQPPL